MNVLLVYAHPDPASFNAAMRDTAIQTLTQLGHAVQVSDLYAMKFKAVIDQDDFPNRLNPDLLQIAKEQRHATETGTFPPDIAAEHEKLKWADLIIFQFPYWWGSMPAIMKGYVERVFAVGTIYGKDVVGLAGRKAMVAMTAGSSPPSEERRQARTEAIIAEIHHIHNNMFRLAGLEVLPPFIAFGVAAVDDEQRQTYLAQYQQRLAAVTAGEGT